MYEDLPPRPRHGAPSALLPASALKRVDPREAAEVKKHILRVSVLVADLERRGQDPVAGLNALLGMPPSLVRELLPISGRVATSLRVTEGDLIAWCEAVTRWVPCQPDRDS
jgi:hypothetical protein